MGLREYHRKRDFAITPEPKGEESPGSGRSFCIQKHAATRLHYDFRLELDGVLKSWAVPKGPSFDPADKRLAMQTRTIPIEYGGFEGIIPAGRIRRRHGAAVGPRHLGAARGSAPGPAQGRASSSVCDGEKLKGGWTLVKIKGRDARDDAKSWLLIKERDELVRPSSEYDVTKERPESVATGRTLEEIAADRDRVWNSNRDGRSPARSKGGARRAARVARAKPASAEGQAAPRPRGRGRRRTRGAQGTAAGGGRGRSWPPSWTSRPRATSGCTR